MHVWQTRESHSDDCHRGGKQSLEGQERRAKWKQKHRRFSPIVTSIPGSVFWAFKHAQRTCSTWKHHNIKSILTLWCLVESQGQKHQREAVNLLHTKVWPRPRFVWNKKRWLWRRAGVFPLLRCAMGSQIRSGRFSEGCVWMRMQILKAWRMKTLLAVAAQTHLNSSFKERWPARVTCGLKPPIRGGTLGGRTSINADLRKIKVLNSRSEAELTRTRAWNLLSNAFHLLPKVVLILPLKSKSRAVNHDSLDLLALPPNADENSCSTQGSRRRRFLLFCYTWSSFSVYKVDEKEPRG